MSIKFIGVIFALVTILQIGFGLKCHFQIDTTDQNYFESHECSFAKATETHKKLKYFFKIAEIDPTVTTFDCLKMNLKFDTENTKPFYDKGCIFSNFKACDLEARQKLTKTCIQCDKDNCNPAGRVVSQLGLIGVSVIVAVITKMIL